ncbi:MAG: hypothetical protein K2V38_05855 [Gemmataceae bacterium]|nr:hypothetical protein [Gemmataceae bacterium]
MITPPRRSVTRFFIPLIDVLILLFCIFLLMPFVSGPATPEEPEKKAEPAPEKLPEDVRELQRRLREAEDRLKRLEKAALSRITDRLTVKVLEVDKRDGTLFYYDPDRQEIRTEADALRLIARQKTAASTAGGVKDVMFLILYPREPSGFPTKKQEDQIRHWFRDVPVTFE